MSLKYKWFKPFETVSKPQQIDPKLLSKKTMGKYSTDLEKKLKKILKVKYVVLTNSGTSALMMANLALGINKNTKIITTNLSWIATINPSIILGSKIFLVDTEPYSQRVNFKTLNKMIKKVKPNIVILSHLSGAAHIDKEFVRLKKKYAFKVIEDAAQSFLHKFKKNKFFGTLFEVGCFSLSITKIVNMVYGGFCTTNSKTIANKLVAIRNNGVNALPENSRDELPSQRGLNFKPSDLHSFFGLKNLNKHKAIVRRVSDISKYYFNNLRNSKFSFLDNYLNNPRIYPSIIVDNKKKFNNFL